MKIAIFRELPITFKGGVTNVLCHLLHHLKKNGHETIVFAPDKEKRVRRFMGARLVGVPTVDFAFLRNKNFSFPISNDRFLDPIFKRFQPDLVHLLHPMSLSWAAYASAKKSNIPVLASYHTNYHIYIDFYKLGFFKNALWKYTRWLFNQSHKVLSPSLSVKEMLEQGGIKQVDVWTRGVDSTLFSPKKRTQKIRKILTGGHPEKTVFLYTGRLFKEKNIHFLADHWKPNSKARLVITGEGPERAALENKLQGKDVLFTGHQQGKSLAQIYASSDVLIFPSTTEGYPNVAMEALASGLPVIGANAFGIKDILQESQAGFIYEPSDWQTLNQYILELIKKPKLREQLSLRARQFAQTKTWEKMMGELFSHYEELIKKSSHHPHSLLTHTASQN